MKTFIYTCFMLITDNFRKIIWNIYSKYFFPKNTLVISFYADYDGSLRYEKAASKLSNSLTKWKIPHEFVRIKDQGGYRSNTLYKPKFIYSKILEHKKNIIWIDCDTDLNSAEAVCRIAQINKPVGAMSKTSDINSMMGGLLNFTFEEKSLRMLRLWWLHCQYATDNSIYELDHDALKHAVIPRFEGQDIVEYIKMDNKKIGFIASAKDNSKIQIYHKEASILNHETRLEILNRITWIPKFLDKEENLLLFLDEVKTMNNVCQYKIELFMDNVNLGNEDKIIFNSLLNNTI